MKILHCITCFFGKLLPKIIKYSQCSYYFFITILSIYITQRIQHSFLVKKTLRETNNVKKLKSIAPKYTTFSEINY